MKLDREQLAELAHLHATEGLEGEDLARFEAWRRQATAEERAEFVALVDSAAALLQAGAPALEVPAGSWEAIEARLGEDRGEAGHQHRRADEGEWLGLPVPGVRIKPLSDDERDGVTVFLLEMDAGSRFPAHRHHGVEMAYVLEGDLRSGATRLGAGDFLRAPAGSEHEHLSSEGGCRALLITASENLPRHAVSGLQRVHDAVRAFRDLWRGPRN